MDYSKTYSTIDKMQQNVMLLYASKYSNSKYKLNVNINSIILTDESLKEVSNSNTQSNSNTTNSSS